MPLFVFLCRECGAKQEVIQKFDDPNPICGCGFEMIREISPCNFKLNGGGWAADGYGKLKTKNLDLTGTDHT